MPARPAAAHDPDGYLSAPQVLKRFAISDMTLFRWLKNPENDFPRPIYFGPRRYWKLPDLEAWERRAAARSAERIPAHP